MTERICYVKSREISIYLFTRPCNIIVAQFLENESSMIIEVFSLVFYIPDAYIITTT